MNIATAKMTDETKNWGTPHAFHLNLPPNHFDEDGVPHITKFAHKKARMVVDLAMSIQLSEDMFVHGAGLGEDAMDVDDREDKDDDEWKDTLVRFDFTVEMDIHCVCWL